jgi:hypothetical protein
MTDYIIPGMLSLTHGPDLLNTERPFATST